MSPMREAPCDQGASPTVFRPAVAALLTAAALALPASASAALLVADAPDCDSSPLAKVFLPWADPADYVLAPGGAAESAAGWTFTGGAGIVAGSEPYAVHDAADASALRLPSGATATTATMCVGIEHPTLRLFSTSTLGRGSVYVDVLFETANGTVLSAPVGGVTGGAWAPSAVMPVLASLLPLLPGEHTPVRFRFTSSGPGAVTIDDVYVDPFGRY